MKLFVPFSLAALAVGNQLTAEGGLQRVTRSERLADQAELKRAKREERKIARAARKAEKIARKLRAREAREKRRAERRRDGLLSSLISTLNQDFRFHKL